MAEQLNDDDLQVVTGAAYTGPVFPYGVKKGDTLYTIANKHHTTVMILAEINHIQNVNLIYAGKLIMIPMKR